MLCSVSLKYFCKLSSLNVLTCITSTDKKKKRWARPFKSKAQQSIQAVCYLSYVVVVADIIHAPLLPSYVSCHALINVKVLIININKMHSHFCHFFYQFSAGHFFHLWKQIIFCLHKHKGSHMNSSYKSV